jgi:flagellar hook-associated protein 3 FlgL
MAELDTSMKAVSDVHTDVGTRLQRIDMQYDMNQDFKGGLTENLSKLRDQDMVTGISDYQKTLSGLQMAQLTYSKISELSLFNYLR